MRRLVPVTWRPGSIDDAVEQWSLVPDGSVIITPSSRLLPVLHRGRSAMLKVPLVEEEAIGGRLLAAWNGSGAAAVFEVDDQAIVLERAVGGRDLTALTRAGDDLEAVAIICAVLEALHAVIPAGTRQDPAPADTEHPELPTLQRWFRDLAQVGDSAATPLTADTASAAFLTRGWTTADRLLATTSPTDIVVLHGDLHHGNVLEFAPGDWRAIDPKGIVGHRAFDATALFSNPDPQTATDAALFVARVDLVSRAVNVPRPTLLEWIVARMALSAAWSLQDDDAENADTVIRVGLLAEAALGGPIPTGS